MGKTEKYRFSTPSSMSVVVVNAGWANPVDVVASIVEVVVVVVVVVVVASAAIVANKGLATTSAGELFLSSAELLVTPIPSRDASGVIIVVSAAAVVAAAVSFVVASVEDFGDQSSGEFPSKREKFD